MPRKTSWERVKEGNGLKASKDDLQELIKLYEGVMGKAHDVDFNNPEAKFTVRVWDGMDGCWCDSASGVGALEALKHWCERTNDGTERTKFADIDYYRIYPADTKMHWSGDREMFR